MHLYSYNCVRTSRHMKSQASKAQHNKLSENTNKQQNQHVYISLYIYTHVFTFTYVSICLVSLSICLSVYLCRHRPLTFWLRILGPPADSPVAAWPPSAAPAPPCRTCEVVNTLALEALGRPPTLPESGARLLIQSLVFFDTVDDISPASPIIYYTAIMAIGYWYTKSCRIYTINSGYSPYAIPLQWSVDHGSTWRACGL